MAQVNIRMDAEMKKQAEDFFAALGLTMSTAITAFIAQSLREGRIPFELSLKPAQDNMFYSERNMAHLHKIIGEMEAGKASYVTKTWDELEAMTNE